MRRQAEARLRNQLGRKPKPAIPKSTADRQRLLHELQVHQIELEMQNAELQDARDRTAILLEKYTDLYDFAPVGYFTLDNQSTIQEVNLTGSSLLGTDRSRLINQRLSRSLTPASHADFQRFLGRIFAGFENQACEVTVVKRDATAFRANLHGALLVASSGPPKSCRVVVSDITAHKQAEEAQHRLEALAASILTLEQEIAHHKEREGSLRKSDRHHIQLLAKSHQMQERLRQLSHQIMSAQDDEHRQISRELYAVISQALAGINIRLEMIKMETAIDSNELDSRINGMKRIVEDSMGIVDRFSRQFHPTVLDDLGLIPALRSYVQDFTQQTRIDVQLHVFPGVEELSIDKKTAFYHVVQETFAHVIRYTRARQANITIDKTKIGARMKIFCNGTACQRAIRSRVEKSKELELFGLNERMEMVGGSFAIKSIKGVGITMTASIPYGKIS